MKKRCDWAVSRVLADYHDKEWGRLTFNDRRHFEHIALSGFQAGLTWEMILKRRSHLRKQFAGFDPKRIIKFDDKRIQSIVNDGKGIRNKRKIISVINNAKAFVAVKKERGSFGRYVFGLLKNKVRTNNYKSWTKIPAYSKDAVKLSKELRKKWGFSFFGPTIAYAYMQSIGFVDDHIKDCFRKRNKSGQLSA